MHSKCSIERVAPVAFSAARAASAMLEARAPGAGKSLRSVALSELRVESLPKRRVPAGAILMEPEQKTEGLVFIAEGRVRLYRLAPTGEEVFQGELGPGDSIKCPRLLGYSRCQAFAQAVVDSTIEILPNTALRMLMERCALFNQVLMREIAEQIARLDQRLYEASVMPMKIRLQAELLRIARRGADGRLAIIPAPTHEEFAHRIGTQREAVSKQLGQLARDGRLAKKRGSIVILNEAVLRREVAYWNDGGGCER